MNASTANCPAGTTVKAVLHHIHGVGLGIGTNQGRFLGGFLKLSDAESDSSIFYYTLRCTIFAFDLPEIEPLGLRHDFSLQLALELNENCTREPGLKNRRIHVLVSLEADVNPTFVQASGRRSNL